MSVFFALLGTAAVLALGALIVWLAVRSQHSTPVTAGCPSGQECLSPPTSACEALKGKALSDVNILATVSADGHLQNIATESDCSTKCIALSPQTIGYTYDTQSQDCWCIEDPVTGLKPQSDFGAMFFDRE